MVFIKRTYLNPPIVLISLFAQSVKELKIDGIKSLNDDVESGIELISDYVFSHDCFIKIDQWRYWVTKELRALNHNFDISSRQVTLVLLNSVVILGQSRSLLPNWLPHTGSKLAYPNQLKKRGRRKRFISCHTMKLEIFRILPCMPSG